MSLALLALPLLFLAALFWKPLSARLRVLAVVVLAMLTPAMAFAQEASGAPSGGIGAVLLNLATGLLSNEAVLLALAGLAVHFYRQFRGDKADKEIQAFDLAVKLAYDGTRNFAALYPGKALDKASHALGLFSKALATELGREPTPAEAESAKLHFDAAHAAEAESKARAKLAAEIVAAPVAPSVP